MFKTFVIDMLAKYLLVDVDHIAAKWIASFEYLDEFVLMILDQILSELLLIHRESHITTIAKMVYVFLFS